MTLNPTLQPNEILLDTLTLNATLYTHISLYMHIEGNFKMAVPTENVINTPISDPVTKAVVDNIMGNLPTKKPLVRCEDCDLSFTSQTVLDAHLQGARHAKQVKSKAIMAVLDNTKVAFTKDQETNGLRCNVCNVSLNSIQQLQTHLNGNRHKKKATKGGWNEREASVASFITPPIAAGPILPTKSTFLTCDICNKLFNSQGQYDEHILSKKHCAKLNSTNSPGNKRFVPYRKKQRSIDNSVSYMKSLSNNFIPDGYENYT
ncbi:zinc finger protein 346 isoform X1 [Neodiprion pinetum]|uniref:Zinc finger protein 385A isoform X1 n=2 Tax=Neodiprion lecontei TaxID=441921 RepID=A0ABM3FCH9_NEOLC|nr:zinc finger protein 385A-like isoform X1 [Neodiprion pinetum]XP_046585721.1 zinc finger protein 385A isoform X1 [Neodiprion lecontei]